MSRPIWLQRTPHAHSTTPFSLDKEVILKQLPTVVRAPCYQTQARFQEKTFDRRHKERISTNEWQRPYSHETFDQTKYCPSRERQYHSARVNSNIYPEPHSMPTRKADGVDRAFPLKPVYHKRSSNVNIGTASNKDESQRLPIPYVPLPPQGRPEYHGRVGKAGNRKPLEDHSTPLKGYTNGRDVAGSQQYKEEKLPEAQRRLAKEIHRKELILQEKLWKTGEQLRKRIERERTASGDDTRTEERRVRRPAETEKEWTETEEQQRRRIQRARVASGDDSRREERHVRRPAEIEKEWTENKVPAERRRRDIGGQERVRRERSIKREKAQEDTEWQEEKREEKSRDRRVKKTHDEEDWDRGERRTVKQPEWSTERRTSERGAERERNRNAGWERLEREKLKERVDMRKERDEREERENNLLWNRWEREKGRVEEHSRKVVEEDIDWERETKWERSSERYVSSDEKRREQNLARRGKIQEEAQHRPTSRLVTGGSSSASSKGMSREAHTSVLSPPHANRPLQVELSPRESADDASPQLVPCRICHRSFVAERLEKHHKACEKMQKSNRKVFDSARYRAKGTELEEFMKTNSRSKTPELKKNNWRQKHEVFMRNMRQGRVPDGASQPAPSMQDDPDYVTCPHCARRFAPGPAERHIPMCQNIRSRPPPPRPRR